MWEKKIIFKNSSFKRGGNRLRPTARGFRAGGSGAGCQHCLLLMEALEAAPDVSSCCLQSEKVGQGDRRQQRERERDTQRKIEMERGWACCGRDRQTLRDQRQFGERSWRPQDRPGCRAAWETSQRRTSVGGGGGRIQPGGRDTTDGDDQPEGPQRELPSQAL